MNMAGDWICSTCQHFNFYWRQQCQSCNEPFVPLSMIGTYGSGSSICNYRPGDWFCDVGTCRAHNYASRVICFMCGAKKSKPSFGDSVGYYNPIFHPMNFGFYGVRRGTLGYRGWIAGDWFCGRRDCNAHNYGPRVYCFKCNSSRELVRYLSN